MYLMLILFISFLDDFILDLQFSLLLQLYFFEFCLVIELLL